VESAGGGEGRGLGWREEVRGAAVPGSGNSGDISTMKAPDGPPQSRGQFDLLLEPGT